MNRTDLQQLADVRIAEAHALLTLAVPMSDGAYYLAGYAVECALKACIAKTVNQHDFPDKELATDGEKAAARTINIIDSQIGADNLAALIIEPIQGEGGFIVPAEGFLPTLLDWCHNNDVVFIADEVQTGFARTGAMFAC